MKGKALSRLLLIDAVAFIEACKPCVLNTCNLKPLISVLLLNTPHHAKQIAAVDFFTVPTITFRNLYCFVVLLHDRRQIIHFNVTGRPTAVWTAQQIVEAFPEDTAPRYLLRDRDQIYGEEFRRRVAGMQIEEVPTAPRSPFQNEYASHYTSSVRSGMNAFIRSLSRSFWPCALTGGCGPGPSYKRAFLSS